MTTTKIAVKSITIARAEGLSHECYETKHETWASAESRISRICATAPKKGGYDKCDFKIEWADGQVYEGRYDAAFPGSRSYEGTLAGHVEGNLIFRSGSRCPAHLNENKYQQMLANQEKYRPGIKAESLRLFVGYSFSDR